METFEHWLKRVFDHPGKGPEWYWDSDADTSAPEPGTCVRYLSRLFGDSGRYLPRFSDGQVARGLWFLVSNGCSDHMGALFEPSVPLSDRIGCVRQIPSLFAHTFATRCEVVLSHLDRDGAAPPLNVTCYMWWDLFPTWGSTPTDLDAAILQAMEETLSSDSIVCQEAALHGLGHWCAARTRAVEAAVNRYLEGSGTSARAGVPTRPPELISYARAAAMGCVL